MDWQSLGLLVKASRKKYLKKMVEYAATIAHQAKAVPQHAITPISQQYPADLQLTAEEGHKLMTALVELVKKSQEGTQGLKEEIEEKLGGELGGVVWEQLEKIRGEVEESWAGRVRQAERLISFDWQLDMEVASDKGKTNTPVVQLQLTTAKESRATSTSVNLRGPQFEVFFKNLQKIKQQLSELVTQAE